VTRAGWVAVTAAAVLLSLGYGLGYPELLALGVGALALLALGALLVAGRPAVEVERQVEPYRVGRGDPAIALLVVRNPSSRRRLRVEVVEPVTRTVGSTSDTTELRVAVPTLARSGVRRRTYRLPTERRGVLTVGPLRWERSDPFGLWRRRQQVEQVRTLYVHPRVHSLVLAASGRARHLDGPTSDKAPRGSITFQALREYVRGDDMRLIHWRSSARLGTLMVKESVDTAMPHTTVLLDTRASSYDSPDRFEEAVDVVASLLTAATSAQFPCRLVTTGGVQAEGKGSTEETRALLDLLSGLDADSDAGFLALADGLDHRRSNSTVVAVTGQVQGQDAAADLAALRTLARRYDRGLLLRLVPVGAPPVGGSDDLVVIDSEGALQAVTAWNVWSRR
jgi:uncharacterized protein (DUF58 family)